MYSIDAINFLKEKGYEIIYKSRGEDFWIENISSLQGLMPNSICWIKAEKFATEDIVKNICDIGTVLVVCPFEIEGANCIITQCPKGVFFEILNHFFYKEFKHEISCKATVLTGKIGDNVHIGPNCYICEDVTIGDNTIIHPNVNIISHCSIGHDCEIYPGVVIGADGYGYYFEGDVPHREKHFMGVRIGNNVDIGANTCIDRGLITDTIIKDNVKIDNLCHISHNVVVEENTLIIAGTVVCGSAVIKKNAYLAPGSTVLNQITVEERGMVGSNSLAIRKVKKGTTIFGVPGRCIRKE